MPGQIPRRRPSIWIGPAVPALADRLECRMLLSSTGSIMGTVFADPNQTGAAAGNSGLAGREVYVDLAGAGVLEDGDPFAVTDANGNYTIANVPAGSQLVRDIVPQGWGQTSPATDDAEVTVTAGQSTVQDFGQLQLGSTQQFNIGFTAESSAIQSDGKIVIVGHSGDPTSGDEQSVVARYFPDGTPDKLFGGSGTGEIVESVGDSTTGPSQSAAHDVLVEADGDIIVVGGYDIDEDFPGQTQSYQERFTAAGVADDTFLGLSQHEGSGYDIENTGVLQLPDGSILVSGYGENDDNTEIEPGSGHIILEDHDDATGEEVQSWGDLADGQPGYINMQFPSGTADVSASRAAVDPYDGELFLPLTVTYTGENSQFAVQSYTSSGVPEDYVTLNFPYSGDAVENTSAVQSQGELLIAGYAPGPDGTNDFAIARFTSSNGALSLDSSFGTNGTVLTSLGGDDRATDIQVLPDGSFLVIGTSTVNGVTNQIVEEYSANGQSSQEVSNDPDPTAGVPILAYAAGGDAGTPSPDTLAESTSRGSTILKWALTNGSVGFPQAPVAVGGGTVKDVNVETTPPTAAFQAAGNIAAASTSPELIQVQYSDPIGVDLLTLDSDNLEIRTASGAVETPIYLGIDKSANQNFTAKLFTADYALAAPDGAWTSAQDGPYTVSLQANQVRNSSLFAPAVTDFGSFTVSVPMTATNAPAATLAPVSPITSGGSQPLTLTVTYTGAAAIDASSIGVGNLVVINSTTGDTLTIASAAAGASSGDTLSATYTVAAPDGGWTADDDGLYSVALVAGQVTDADGNAAGAESLGSFQVAVGETLLPTTLTLASPVTTIDSGNLALFTATVSPASGTGTPTGTVSFYDGSTLLGTAALLNGSASFSTVNLAPGTDAITADYGGDSLFLGSSSTSADTITVNAPAAGAAALTPGVVPAALPSVIAGVKHPFAVTVLIDNSGQTSYRGTATVNLFASSDTNLDANDLLVTKPVRVSVKLKPGQSAKVPIKIASLPATLAAGSYYLLAQVMDASGFAQTAASGTTLAVAAPAVEPSVSFVRISLPASAKTGGKTKGAIALHLANAGNVPIGGLVAVSLYLTDQSALGDGDTLPADATLVTTREIKVSVPAGRTGTISVPITSLPVMSSLGPFNFVATVAVPASIAPAATAIALDPTDLALSPAPILISPIIGGVGFTTG